MNNRVFFRNSSLRSGSPGVLADNRRKVSTSNRPLSWIRQRLYLLTAGLALVVYAVLAIRLRFFTAEKQWLPPLHRVFKPASLVFDTLQLRSFWEWEIAAGHYPSSRQLPLYVEDTAVENPARPRQKYAGATRTYTSPRVSSANAAYPPRPIPGSAADLDVIMDHCDFSADKYVRDCLKTLRAGAELDTTSRRIRGGSDDRFKYIYLPEGERGAVYPRASSNDSSFNRRKVDGVDALDAPAHHLSRQDSSRVRFPSCHGVDTRIFHMFWTGPFTDKPYMALLSYLYTQNLGLHQPVSQPPTHCKTELWFWITQPSWIKYKPDTWEKRMLDELGGNAWAAAFLHPRFADVIKFKAWDTVEQLDATDELRGSWQRHKHKVLISKLAREDWEENGGDIEPDDTRQEGVEVSQVLVPRSPAVGPASAADYDRPSVVLSDLVRFVLCHRYGGIYLDVDTIFLRDWEELWGTPSAFSYRWSRLPRYNTAVLRMHQGSALGTFLLRTATKSGMDFHPIAIGRYLRDAQMGDLLFRLPDALFDSAWLMDEGYHPDRPPQPYLASFHDFFETPPLLGASPEALGFDGFFKGAFSYHYHNDWWTPFDPGRNFPDLGSRFAHSESHATSKSSPESIRDLSWSAALKRTFEAYVRGEQPNMYGEWMQW